MSRCMCVLFAVLVVARPAAAQTTATGSVRGLVNDQQGAVLADVIVSAASPTVPGMHQTTTDQEGRYRLGQLPPGDYVVTAETPGFARFVRTPVTVRAGLNLDVDIVMTVGGINEVVEVTIDTPLLETRNGGHAVNISGQLQRSMPLSERREWFGALNLVPGVTTADEPNGQKGFYVHGADQTSNVVQIDGADMMPSQVAAIRSIGLNTDVIDDIQVRTAGVDASAPLGLGGVINIATANGTNQLKGSATIFAQPRQWNDSNTPGGTSRAVRQLQIDGSLGAPLIADRLWAFGAYRYIDASTGISRSRAQLEALRSLVDHFAPFDSTNRAHFGFAKLTAQVSPTQQLSGFYQYDVNPATAADSVTATPKTTASGGAAAALRLSSVWSNSVTSRLGVAYNDKRTNGRDAGIAAPLQRVYHGTIVFGGRLFGNGRMVDRGSPQTAWSEQPNQKLTMSFDMTVFTDRGPGSHEVQSGLYLQPRIRTGLDDFYPNDGFILEEAVFRTDGENGSTVLPFHRLIYDTTANTRLERQGRDYAVYVQDAWRPHPRLTLNAGVRVDRIGWTDLLFDVTSQLSTEVGPRFSASYMLTADARNVLRAHWGRVHEQASNTGTSVGTATPGYQDLYDLNLDGTFETTYVTPSAFGVTPSRAIDTRLHQPFVDEWGVGFSKQIKGRVAASLDLVHRDFRDRSALVETNGRYDGQMFVGYQDERFNQIYEVTNNRWNWPVYTSLEASLSTRTAHLQGIASYVRQWRHLGGTWQPNDPAFFIQPGAFPNNRAIGNTTGSVGFPIDADSLSGFSMAQLETGSSQWQDHVVRAGVTYQAPWQLILSAHYTFQSGAWSGPIVTAIPAPDPMFGPPTRTLSNGRTVANPLATTIRFAYETRGQGQLRTPSLHVWNIRAGRRFQLGRIALDASLDVFNLTNHDADASFVAGGNQAFSPSYGLTTYRQLPRSAQAVLRLSF